MSPNLSSAGKNDQSVKHNFIKYPIQHLPSVQVIASALIIKCYTLIAGFSVHSGLPLFSVGLSVSADRKPEFLFTEELGFLGVKEPTTFLH